MSVRTGDKAPRFTLPNQRDQPVDLPRAAELNLLVFYRGDW